MNRTFYITLIVSAAACLFVIVGQVAKTKNISRQLADERSKATLTIDRKPGTPEPPEREPSGEKIESALARVVALQSNVLEISPVLSKEILDAEDQLKIDYNGIEAAYAKIFPDFLRSVEGLSVEELIEVANAIPDPETVNWMGRPRTKRWLLLLAAEKDPMRIYRDEALMAGTSASEVLEILGREDPAAALRQLPPMEKLTSEPSSSGRRMASIRGNWALGARIRSGIRLLGTDPELGLQTLAEVHDNYGYIPPGMSRPLGTIPLPPAAIPGLIDAMDRPEYAEMRGDFIEMIVTDTVFDGGVAAAAERVEQMALSEGEFNTAIDKMIKNDIMGGEPEQMIEWMSEVRPDKVPTLINRWAGTDMKAATDWLVQQDPSPARDRAIAQFATKASTLDRDVAAQWAREIDDEKLQEETLRRMEKWWTQQPERENENR